MADAFNVIVNMGLREVEAANRARCFIPSGYRSRQEMIRTSGSPKAHVTGPYGVTNEMKQPADFSAGRDFI